VAFEVGLPDEGNRIGTTIAETPVIAGNTMWKVTSVPASTGVRANVFRQAPLESVALSAKRVAGTTSVISTSFACWRRSVAPSPPIGSGSRRC